jgi:hypothetical protein
MVGGDRREAQLSSEARAGRGISSKHRLECPEWPVKVAAARTPHALRGEHRVAGGAAHWQQNLARVSRSTRHRTYRGSR